MGSILHDLGLLLMRVSFAGLMIPHGLGKLKAFSTMQMTFPDPLGVGPPFSLGLAIFGELFCPVFMILGLFTRLMTIPPAVTMAVATFVIHAADPMEKKELALVYFLAYLSIVLAGPGDFSLDHLIRRKRL